MADKNITISFQFFLVKDEYTMLKVCSICEEQIFSNGSRVVLYQKESGVFHESDICFCEGCTVDRLVLE